VSAPLDELYFTWLYDHVADSSIEDPSKTYWELLRQMYCKEFVWFVPNDDNRIEDGRDLRLEFFNDFPDLDVDSDWVDQGCSIFELMVGLSRRLSFEAEGAPHRWFWEMMSNLKISNFSDDFYHSVSNADLVIEGILDNVIWRTYKKNGDGGLFPLKNPTRDQRNVEIWYQLNAYLLESE